MMNTEKNWIKELSLSQIALISYSLSGIAWFAVSVSILLHNRCNSTIQTLLIVLAIVLNTFQISAVLPKSKEDEMSENNLLRAKASTLTCVKMMIPIVLAAVLFITLWTIRIGIKSISVSVLLIGATALPVAVLGIINLLTGLFFRKYEKE